MVASCKDHEPNSNIGATVEAFEQFSAEGCRVDSFRIRCLVDSLIRNDRDSMTADYRTRSYYINGGEFLWIDRKGVDCRADTLLCYLRTVGQDGFSTRKFGVEYIERYLHKLRSLDVADKGHDVNQILACLEYRLTKSYLRYVAGQRFGFVNPTYVFNRLDTLEKSRYDTMPRPVRYRGLFDIDMQHANRGFFFAALQKIRVDSVGEFLAEAQPRSRFYLSLRRKLQEEGVSKAMRAKILCNMERERWRLADEPQKHSKYVLVNVASLHLMAMDGTDTLMMRIGCGSSKTKTPLLSSRIKRMDVNPQWFVPRSIVEKDIIHHVGNYSYFHSRNFYVMDRKTGKEVDLGSVTAGMLRNPAYAVVQRGGKGNSLGRLIFRFDNNFSVFLHDTSSRGVFSREDRSVSHGCVRVEKPLELGIFLMSDKKQRMIEKLKYSMTADSLADRSMVVGSIKVEPEVPIFITYYTLYPMSGGRMADYPDIYGYDKIIYHRLLNYM